MTRLLPPLHDGHAPIFLHRAFDEALDAYEDWHPRVSEPEVDYEGRAVPISSVFGRMRSCTDRLPSRTRDTVKAVVGPEAPVEMLDDDDVTYAQAAQLMCSLAVARLRSQEEPGHDYHQ